MPKKWFINQREGNQICRKKRFWTKFYDLDLKKCILSYTILNCTVHLKKKNVSLHKMLYKFIYIWKIIGKIKRWQFYNTCKFPNALKFWDSLSESIEILTWFPISKISHKTLFKVDSCIVWPRKGLVFSSKLPRIRFESDISVIIQHKIKISTCFSSLSAHFSNKAAVNIWDIIICFAKTTDTYPLLQEEVYTLFIFYQLLIHFTLLYILFNNVTNNVVRKF